MPDHASELVIEQVSHAFGPAEVLREAGLSVPPGAIHCLLGASGSGKTTLLRLVAGLEVLQRGRISIGGLEMAAPRRHVPPDKRPIGFVFQDYALFPHLSVRDNVLFGIPKRSGTDRVARMRSLLEQVDMARFEHAMPHTLSGGQQQRVALARAMGREPRVMLLDEPFSGLDVRLRDEVRRATIRVLRAAGVATLMVTHDPHEAMLIGDAVSIIDHGRIEQTGPPHELYAEPSCISVATALGEANLFACQVVAGAVVTPWGTFAANGLDEGRRVTVMVRPTDLALSGQGQPDSVSAEVIEARLAGGYLHVAARLVDGREVKAIAPADGRTPPAGTVHLSLAVARPRIFPNGPAT